MNDRIGPWETATLTSDRSAALQHVEAYRQALRKAGGRPPVSPRNGKRQLWNAVNGWHDDDRDPLLDPLTRFLSPAARAMYQGRKRERADAALVNDVRAGRRAPDLEYRRVVQRQAEREVTRDRFRDYLGR